MSQTKAQLISDLVQALNFTGTASAPANGAFLSATNTLALATNSAQRLTIDSSGNVGIGTTSPNRHLHLHESDSTGATVRFTNTTTGSGENDGLTVGINSSEQAEFWQRENTAMVFGTNNTQRMAISASGNVGIGAASPSSELHVSALGASDEPTLRIASQNSTIFLRTAGSSGSFPTGGGGDDGELTYIGGDFRLGIGTASKNLIFFNGSGYTERMRIDSSGNVLVGLSSTLSSNNAKLQVAHTDGNADIIVHRAGNNANPPSLNFQKTRNTSIGNYGTIVQSGDELGSLRWGGADGSNIAFAARIVGAVDGTPGANDMPGRIQFHTSSDGSESLTERMRIDSSGDVTVNFDGAGNQTGQFKIADGTASAPGLSFWADGSNDTGIFRSGANTLNFSTAGSERMRIDSSGNVGIGTTSPSTPLDVVGTGIVRVRNATADNADKQAFFTTGHYDTAEEDVLGLRIVGGNADNVVDIGGGSGQSSFNAATKIRFYTGANDTTLAGTERLRINPDGNIGVNITSPARHLHLNGSDSDTVQLHITNSTTGTTGSDGVSFALGSDESLIINQRESNHIALKTADAERMRIDSSGRVIVGSSSHIGGAQFVVMGGNINTYGVVAIGNKDDNPIENATFAQVRLNSGATGTRRGAEIRFQPGATWTDGSSHPTKMIVSLVKENNTGSTDRFRIDQHGRIDHLADVANGYDLHVGFSDSNLAFAIRNSSTTLDDGNIVMRVEGDGDVQNANNSFGAISDISIKENIVDANSQLNDIKALKVRNFNFKKETGYGSHTQIGLVAQELEIVSPGLVKEDHEGLKEVKYSVLYMKAIKALQETIAKVETLETKVAALEAA